MLYDCRGVPRLPSTRSALASIFTPLAPLPWRLLLHAAVAYRQRLQYGQTTLLTA